jgi:hypothetical protein
MFFQADAINNVLICKICDNKMVDPRLLPCGKSVCHQCVDIIADTDKKRIKCQNCAKIHEIPDEGFLKNLALQELLECEAKEVSRSNLIEEFKKILDTLNSTKESIETILECGDVKIRDHCDKVRNDMQLAIEQAREKLDKIHTDLSDEIHKKFMDEIDNHEKQCQENFKSIRQNKVDIEKALNESNELLSKSDRLLKQFRIDQTDLATLFESAYNLLINLEFIKDGIHTNMFNHILLKFEKPKSFGSSVIGKIVKRNIDLHFLDNIEKMRELDLVFYIEFNQFSLNLQPFKSNSFLLLYSFWGLFNLICLDKNGNTLFDKSDLIKNEEILKFTHLKFGSSSHGKIVYIFTGEEHLYHIKTIYNLRSFDENFNLLAEIKLDKEPAEYLVNGENLFLLTKNEKCCTISMYNQNLEIINKFGQVNPNLPFFFSREYGHFLVSNQYFIINEPIFDEDNDSHNGVTIINRSNGLVEASFIIYEHFHQMQLYLNKILIIFNRDTCFLKCYNFKGDSLYKMTLDRKFKGSFINVIEKELFFVLVDNKILAF